MGDSHTDIDAAVVPIEGIIRSAYVMSHVMKLIEVLEQADAISASYPRQVKSGLLCEAKEDTFGAASQSHLAISFSQLTKATRANIRAMLEDVRVFVGVWTDDEGAGEDQEKLLYGMLDESDIRIIEAMITFIQKVGPKSIRHLLQFLEATNDGERGYLLIQSAGRDTEVRHRYEVSEEVLSHFDIRNNQQG